MSQGLDEESLALLHSIIEDARRTACGSRDMALTTLAREVDVWLAESGNDEELMKLWVAPWSYERDEEGRLVVEADEADAAEAFLDKCSEVF